jgi:ribosomal protein S12 methylthiotransferase accessory factor
MTEALSIPKTRTVANPAAMLEAVRPLLPECGVTRLANITGLDRIGIPVAIAVRPESESLAVDSGKGTTIEQALCSAAMESMERHWAEVSPVDYYRQCQMELNGEGHTYEVNFPLTKYGRIPSPDQRIDWVEAEDYLTGGPVFVPRRLVQTDFGREEGLIEKMFYSTTSGLSAGPTAEAAYLQGLYEVVERDACHLALDRMMRTGILPAVRLETIECAGVLTMLHKIEAAGCGAVILDCQSEVKVPTFAAWIFDREAPELGIFRGYGAHLSPEVAVTRAICEAAQARAVLLAGARDDYSHSKWIQNRNIGAEGMRSLAELTGVTDFPQGDFAATGATTEEQEMREVVARCVEAGFHRILTYEFELPLRMPFAVVRVLVPGMEGYWSPHVARLSTVKDRP